MRKKVSKHRSVNSPIPAIENEPLCHYNPDDSIAWDIEKNSEVMSKSDSDDRQGTVLVKYSHGPLEAAAESNSKKIASSISKHSLEFSGESGSPLCPATAKSSSVGPSQSASQLGPRKVEHRSDLKHDRNLPNGPSKYFQCAKPATVSGNLNPVIFDTTISGVPISMKPSEYDNSSDFDFPMLASEQNTETLGAYNSRDMVEEYNFQENHSKCCHAAARPRDMRLDSFLSPKYRSWSPYNNVDIDRPESDYARFWDVFEGQMTDSLVLRPDLAVAHDLGHFQTQDTTPVDSFDGKNNPFHAAEYSWNPGPYCPDGNSAIASESFDSSGVLFDVYVAGTDHGFSVHFDDNTRPCSSNSMPVNVEETVSRISTFSDNDIIEHSDTDRLGSPNLDDDESNFDNFRQGRALLYGHDISASKSITLTQLSNVEAEVAGTLKLGHWLPQRL